MGKGANLVTGDYSRGAHGYMIEKGRIGRSLQGFTLAGNMVEMLQSMTMIGTDLIFNRSVVAPTILIETMMVAGA